tara:strand:+ start:3910 stop:8874 length:4965 start_codon:yes stop_codon:yes gene_type:complete
MATLNNTRISDTYFGLIKTIDNAVISATLKQLTDGSGNATGLYINNAGDFKVNSVLEFGSLKDTGENITITKFVDAADGIGNNNNDTTIPTSAAIVSYVAAQITAEDLDFTGDDAAVAGDVDLNSEQFRILGTTNEIETSVVSAGGNQLRVGIVTNPALSGNVSIAGNIDFADNAKARFGASQDLEIYHDGSHSYINETGTGNLRIYTNDLEIKSNAGSETLATFATNGAVSLYHDDTLRLSTSNSGLSVTGKISGLTDPTANQDAATKAYVDSLDAGSDLDFGGDSGTGDVNLNTQTFLVSGTTNQITTSATNQELTLSLPSTVHRNLQGNVTGNLTGNVTGDVTGNIAGVGTLSDGSTAVTQASSDDSTKIATTAFVKSLDNASDLDFSGDSGTGDVTLNTQTFSVIGTANEVETTASNQQLQIGLPSSINVNSASATILQNARDISLTGQATATISGFDGSSNVSGAVTLDNDSVTGKVLTGLASPTASNILASDSILQAFGKAQSQINTLAGGLRFMGTWNANTNTPTLQSGGGEADSGTTTGTATNKLIQSGQNFTSTVTNGDKVINQASGATALVTNVDSNTQLTLDADIMISGQEYTIDNSPFITQGHYFVVSVGGTSSLNGLSNWAVGDWVIAGAGNVWEKLDHTQVDGTGTAGNIAKFSSTNVIADSIMSESGSTISVTGSLSTSQDVNSSGDINISKTSGALLNINTAQSGADSKILLHEGTTASPANGASIRYDGSNNLFKIGVGTNVDTTRLTIDRGTGLATFANNVTVTGQLLVGSGEYISWGSSGSAAIEGSTVANRLRFYTNSALALTLEADQDAKFEKKVGIGITPAEVLDLKAASGDTRIRLDAVSGSDTEIKFFNDGTAQYTIGHDDASDEFRIAYANVEAPIVKIDKSYNVVIGTLAANETATLVVNNEGGNTPTAKFMSRTNKSIVQISDNDTTGYLSAEGGIFSVGRAAGSNNNNINIENGGEVGFGTQAPNHRVDIYSEDNVALRIHRPNATLDSTNPGGIGFSTRGDGVTSTTDTRSGIFSYYNGNLFFSTNTSSIVADPYASRRLEISSAGVVTIKGSLGITGDGSNAATLTESSAGILTIATVDDLILDCGGDLSLDAAGNDIRLKVNGVEYAKFKDDSDDLAIFSSIQDKDILFKGNDGGSTITALQLDMSNGGSATFSDDIDLGDDKKLNLGASSDLKIYHSGGASSYIENGNGDFYIMQRTLNGNLVFQCDDGSGGDATYFQLDGGSSATNELYTKFPDYSRLAFGSGKDLQIYHDSANSYIQTSTGSAGDLYIQSQGSGHDLYLQAVDDIFIRPQGGENGIKVIGNGEVELYHNNVKRFETTSSGVNAVDLISVNKSNSGQEGGGLLLRNAAGGSGAYNRIYFAPTASSYTTRCAIIQGENTDGNNNMALVFKTSAGADPTEKMRIDNNGNVTIQKSALYVGNDQTSGVTEVVLTNKDTSLVDAGDIQNKLRMRGLFYDQSSSLLVETQICSGHESANGNGNSFLALYTQSGGSSPTEKFRVRSNGAINLATIKPIGHSFTNGTIANGASVTFNANVAGGNQAAGFLVISAVPNSASAGGAVGIFTHIHTQGANIYSELSKREENNITISESGGVFTISNSSGSTIYYQAKTLNMVDFDSTINGY